MKKLISGLLVFVLLLGATAVFSACNKDDETSEIITGAVYEIETDDNDVEYAILKKYTISQADATTIAEDNYESLMLDLVVNEYTDDAKGKTYDVREVAAGAFTNQLILRKITFGENVETIGMGCLAGCTNLEEITLPFVGETKDALNDKKTLGYLFGTSEIENATSVTQNYNVSGTATYFVPNSLKKVTVTGTTISDYAFNGIALEEIILSGAVTKIGEGTFKGVTTMGTITLPASVTEIGKSAFSGCTALYKVNFSAELTTIYQEAFSGCTMLGSYNNKLELPVKLANIYDKAFSGCTALTDIDLSKTAVTSIPTGCFYNCSALEQATIKTGTTKTADSFAMCHKDLQIVEK